MQKFRLINLFLLLSFTSTFHFPSPPNPDLPHSLLFARHPKPQPGRFNKVQYKNQNLDALSLAKKQNKEITQFTSSSEILQYFISSGGGKANFTTYSSVNFSTMTHRIARTAAFFNHQDKIQPHLKILAATSDPRFALLLTAIGDAVHRNPTDFGCRELSNIMWGVAKLKVSTSGCCIGHPQQHHSTSTSTSTTKLTTSCSQSRSARRAGHKNEPQRC